MSESQDLRIEGKIYFLSRSKTYETVKPYTLRYTPEDDFPQTNVERELYTLPIYDMRNGFNLNYDNCGFKVANLQSQMCYDDYDDPRKVESIHQQEVTECVKKSLDASSVEVQDYVIRRRDPQWPIATGEAYKSQQPASAAHIDHTYDASCKMIRDIYGEKADLVIDSQWQMVNVWHPLQGPLVDWPMALCSAATVDFENDTMAGDIVDREAVFENTQVHYNPKQKWFYLPNQMPSELLIFKNADGGTPHGSTPGVPHASFDNPLTTELDFRRESIEFRVLVKW